MAAKPQDLCNFLLKTVSVFYTCRAPTRGQCHSGRFCERLRKAFRISPLAHPLSSGGSKEPCCIFSHPNAILNCQKDWCYRLCCEEDGKRTRKFAYSPSAARGTIMETQPSTFQSAQNQATFPAGRYNLVRAYAFSGNVRFNLTSRYLAATPRLGSPRHSTFLKLAILSTCSTHDALSSRS